MEKNMLQSTTEVNVRFNELDPLRIVWHGNYLKYFEDGREDFGKKYKLSYIDVKDAGLATPIIKANVDYKCALRYPETIIIETTYEPHPAAKIILHYKILRKGTNEVIAEGQTIQVFTDFDGNLMFCAPEFYTNWKKQWGVE
jgi:acyl-CoA thioester hydrolase